MALGPRGWSGCKFSEPEIIDYWGLSSSGSPKNHSKRWRRHRSPLRMVVGPRDAQIPRIDDFQVKGGVSFSISPPDLAFRFTGCCQRDPESPCPRKTVDWCSLRSGRAQDVSFGTVAIIGYAITVPGRKSLIQGSKRPPPVANTIGKGGGLGSPPFPLCFAVRGGRLDPNIDDFRPGASIA